MIIKNEREATILNKGIKIGQEHSEPSPATIKITKMLMDNQDLIIKTIEDMKKDLCERLERSDETNKEQHNKIIARQDYTNGSIGRLKKSQLILRTALATGFILMAILGFMPERIYAILRGIL